MEPVKERVVQHLKLAQIIASKYFNIQGMSPEEVLSEARVALVRASMAYREEKGPFAPFAGTAIRNALNSLFNKQLRNAKAEVKSLDETIHGVTQFGTYIGNLGQNIADTKKDVIKEVDKREKLKNLKRSISRLNTQEQALMYYFSKGLSLNQIAEKYGVTKQAVFKKYKSTLKKLRLVYERQ